LHDEGQCVVRCARRLARAGPGDQHGIAGRRELARRRNDQDRAARADNQLARQVLIGLGDDDQIAMERVMDDQLVMPAVEVMGCNIDAARHMLQRGGFAFRPTAFDEGGDARAIRLGDAAGQTRAGCAVAIGDMEDDFFD